MHNPYEDDFRQLSRSEMRVVLLKIRIPSCDGFKYMRSGRISLRDVANETTVNYLTLFSIINGWDNHHVRRYYNVPRKKVKILSKWLLMFEHGMIKKVNKKFIYLDEPTKTMQTIQRIVMTPKGPKIESGKQFNVPGLMPSFKKVFQDNAKKVLR